MRLRPPSREVGGARRDLAGDDHLDPHALAVAPAERSAAPSDAPMTRTSAHAAAESRINEVSRTRSIIRDAATVATFAAQDEPRCSRAKAKRSRAASSGPSGPRPRTSGQRRSPRPLPAPRRSAHRDAQDRGGAPRSALGAVVRRNVVVEEQLARNSPQRMYANVRNARIGAATRSVRDIGILVLDLLDDRPEWLIDERDQRSSRSAMPDYGCWRRARRDLPCRTEEEHREQLPQRRLQGEAPPARRRRPPRSTRRRG